MSADGSTVDLRSVDNYYARGQINALVKGVGHKKIGLALPLRQMLHTRYAATLRPFGNVLRKKNQSTLEWYDDWRKDRKQRRLQGDSTIRTNVASKEGETDTADKADTKQQLEETVKEGAYDPDTVRSSFSKFASRSLLGLGLICLINGISVASDEIEYFEIMLPMMRMFTEIIGGAGQTKAGELTATELGFQSQDFYDEKSETSIKDARSIQAELGEPQSGPDIPYSARFGGADDTLEALSSAAGGIPGIKGLCSVAGSWIGFAFELTIDAITNTALPGIGGLIKELGEDAALGRLASTIANYLAAQPVNLNAKGAELGNYINYGARLAANDQAIAMGGRELSSSEEVALKKSVNEKREQDFKSRSWTERLFALDTTQSVSFKLLSALPPRQELLSQLSVPSLMEAFGNTRNWLVHNGVAAADEEEYDYGFPKVAFTPKELEDERFENPFENERKLFEHVEDSDEDEDTNTINEEAKYLQGLNLYYGRPCFNISLDNNGGFSVGALPILEQIDSDFDYLGNSAKRIGTRDDMKGHYQEAKCRSNSETLTRYRFLILDIITQTSMACYEGDEDACREVGLEETSSVSTAPSNSLKHIFEDSSEISCAEGTRNVGVFDGYHEGNKIPVRICAIPGFTSTSPVGSFGVENANGETLVNSRISGNALAMFEAAKADGVNLAAASTFRTMEHQQSLCPCDGVTVAEPGFSNHQMGLAIDFSDLPSSAGPISGDPVWEWLSKNAGKYGYKNYPEEAWHWSVTGS